MRASNGSSQKRMIHKQPDTSMHCASAAALHAEHKDKTPRKPQARALYGWDSRACRCEGMQVRCRPHKAAGHGVAGAHCQLSTQKCKAIIMCWALWQHAKRQAQHSKHKAASLGHYSTHASQASNTVPYSTSQSMLVWQHTQLHHIPPQRATSSLPVESIQCRWQSGPVSQSNMQ